MRKIYKLQKLIIVFKELVFLKHNKIESNFIGKTSIRKYVKQLNRNEQMIL